MPPTYPATTLFLVRHAQARAGDGSYDENTPLSEVGRRQASRVADTLLVGPWPATVYASPYPRAVETAEPLCHKLGLEPTVDPALAEFQLETGSFESIQHRPDLVVWRPDHRGVEGGETLREFSIRVADFCDGVVEQHPGERVVVVTHAGTIDAMLRWSLGITPESPWQHDFELGNASITELEFWPCGRIRGGAPRYAELRRVGDVAHLGGLVSDL